MRATLLLPAVLLLLATCLVQLSDGQMSPSTTPGQVPDWLQSLNALLEAASNTKGAQPTPNTNTTTTTTNNNNNNTAAQQQGSLWTDIFANAMEALSNGGGNSNAGNQKDLGANGTAALGQLLSRLPGAFQGLSALQGLMGGGGGQGGDVGTILSSLFSGIPTEMPSSQCAADLMTLGSGLQQGQVWALQMLDAMGKPSGGILTGMMIFYGDYDECNAISFVNQSVSIEGQYCNLGVKAPDMLSTAGIFSGIPNINLHVCLPQSCDETDLRKIFSSAIVALGSEVVEVNCFHPKDPSGDNIFLGVSITIGILVVLCCAGTLYGLHLDREMDKQRKQNTQNKGKLAANGGHVNGGLTNEKPSILTNGGHVNGGFTNENPSILKNGGHVNGGLTNGDVVITASGEDEMSKAEVGMGNGQNGSAGGMTGNGTASQAAKAVAAPEGLASKLLLSFSVLRNGRKLLNASGNQGDISCLHGIRCLSITWVILGHTMGGAKLFLVSDWTFMAIVGGLLAVDTFFLLSGCLTAFLFLRSTKKSGLSLVGMVIYYVHRIWRLTPLYGLLLAFYMGIFPYMMQGPQQESAGADSSGICRTGWWYNILYINNLVDKGMYCFGWTWYLANDMQFYFIAPICLIPWALRGSARFLGFVLATCLIMTHIITSFTLSYTKEASMFGGNNKIYMDEIYITPWCRVGPYAVGLLLGYILDATRCKYTMSKMSVVLGWTLATAGGLTLVYIHYDDIGHLTTEGMHWKPLSYATYEALAKVLWAVCLSWVVFACVTGYGGFVNTLMSWSAWIPLSRMTYGVYLAHLIILELLAGNARTNVYMDAWQGTVHFLAVTVLSFLSAFVFSMLIEAPTLGLEKAVLGKILRKKP